MKAPEKIYITNLEENPLELDRTWYYAKQVGYHSIEYTRTDAFIEKAIGWIDYNNRNGGCNFDGWEKDFKNYMEGE